MATDSNSRFFSRMFSATREFVDNLRLGSGLQRLSTEQGEVLNKADDVSKTMDKRSCVGTHASNASPKTYAKPLAPPPKSISQREHDLFYLHNKYLYAPEGSEEKAKALQNYQNALEHRSYIDASMDLIGEFLFGTAEKASSVMKVTRRGHYDIDDMSCFKEMENIYVKQFGPVLPYALKHMRGIANMCNAGVEPEDFAKAATYARATLGEVPPQPDIP